MALNLAPIQKIGQIPSECNFRIDAYIKTVEESDENRS
jgi:hypothetical protein